jgi:exopolyphosphatase/guanosine-5'-triphosphate,3'-diphosphate pyrophosphatase
MNHSVAVIDIGSNSIKALVAEKGDGPHSIQPLMEKSLEVRISAGIGKSSPFLTDAGIQLGAQAVAELAQACQIFNVDTIRVVATSAVRSASNGNDFCHAVQSASQLEVEVLSGYQEAEGIADGILSDPELCELREFTAFDLGGGSLELMEFQNRSLKSYHSFELGSVRLMEIFLQHPQNAISQQEQLDCIRHIEDTLRAGPVPFKAPLVGCGGGLTVATRICQTNPGLLPAKANLQNHNFFPKAWFDIIRPLVVDASHGERMRINGIPESRADIFPVAILTCDVLMEMCACSGIYHTTHNLRYGIARQALYPA